MKITRIWAMPNKETFKIKPIKAILNKYVGNGEDWIDPYSGYNSPAEYTNDLNKDIPASQHTTAWDFLCQNWDNFKGGILDPPYSPRQIKECYESIGIKPTNKDTNQEELNKVKNLIAKKIIPGGICISCGWNSNGLGKNRGFEIIEILLIAHGGHHNDTIVTIEKKIQETLKGN